MSALLRGRLLVASPSLEDPNFARSVVLLLAHGDHGALGIILNRPSEAEVSDILPVWHELAAPPAMVFRGGPVAISSAICLARARSRSAIESVEGLEETVVGLVSVDLERDPAIVDAAIHGLRVFSGYAGWTAGQLEAELELGGWIVAEAEPDDPLTSDPDGLWARVLRRQGGLRAAYALAPPQLSLN